MRIRAVIADQWYRIGKEDGQLMAVNGVAVVRAAAGSFKVPVDAINAGRFQTPFAFYSQGKHLTDAEKTVPGEAPTEDVRDDFDRIRRTRACYRCGAGPEHCDCPDEMEPEGVR